MSGSGGRWQWVVGAGVILLFTLLLMIRLDIPGKFFPESRRTISLPEADILAGEAWMNIFQNGRKIGYANRSLIRTEHRVPFFRESLPSNQYDGEYPASDHADNRRNEARRDTFGLSIQSEIESFPVRRTGRGYGE